MTKTSTSNEGSRGLASQVKALINDVSTLFREEIQLAKTEAGERLDSAIHGGQMVVIGAILAIGAVGVLLAALVVAIAGLLESMGMDAGLANTFAAAGVALVVGGIGWAMISSGVKKLKATNFKMERTAHSLSEDANVVRERL
ncbi:phage holin family protein [Pelagibacterium luteolum]|uniref:Putative Holin-X, holin superfamily III n=1 Tax=Pelagibacterium luteolum TaxID=440168 RepID=A0A1G8A695_9HYPH|nr:phage holin family protein [Pelagibacterium luteolum]SDH15910.1 Putative Holin-X, holin superfamily III [Pelagibacterium luteolum]